jgi:hypothetical protein
MIIGALLELRLAAMRRRPRPPRSSSSSASWLRRLLGRSSSSSRGRLRDLRAMADSLRLDDHSPLPYIHSLLIDIKPIS